MEKSTKSNYEPKKTIKCRCCKKSKPRSEYNSTEKGNLRNFCTTCEPFLKRPKGSSKPTEHVANSYEEKRALKITAEEAKKANDLREKEMFNKGAKFVKSIKHIRAYVISR